MVDLKRREGESVWDHLIRVGTRVHRQKRAPELGPSQSCEEALNIEERVRKELK
jgi:hypothetical protein